MVLDVDLNLPPSENMDQEDVHPLQEGSLLLAIIDADSLISAEANNNSPRNYDNTVVIDLDSVERISTVSPDSHMSHERVSSYETCIICYQTNTAFDVCEDSFWCVVPSSMLANNNSPRNYDNTVVFDFDSVERTSTVSPDSHMSHERVSSYETCIICYQTNAVSGVCEGSFWCVDPSSRLFFTYEYPSTSAIARINPPPPVEESNFCCPVCLGPLVEEMTTKCGHIFCKSCIRAAIATQGRCPTCRKKVTMKDTMRVYLPSTS